MRLIPSIAIWSLTLRTLAFPAADPFEWNITTERETRTLDEIHQAALAEGGVVTLWHGGATAEQARPLKTAFEKRFPGMTLNVTVQESYFQAQWINRQLEGDDLYVDSVMLQTLQDYPKWKREKVLMYYQPLGFDEVYNDFRDRDGAYYGYTINGWSIIWNENKLNGTKPPLTFNDFLKPEFKNRIILNYPNDDDAVLYTFQLLLRQYGESWFQSLLAQNPKFVRGTLSYEHVLNANSTYAATFTTTVGLLPQAPLNVSWPGNSAPFTTWPQYAAILRDAPHPESAKLLHSFALSEEYQKGVNSWSVRRDVQTPGGYPKIMEQPGTDPTKFGQWMEDREAVEELRFWFQSQLGVPTGPVS